MIPVYNCSSFLKDTLESVLIQALAEDEMQIEVVDDASTDADVEALVNAIGKGRVKYFCQKENRGSLRNFETCINRAKGTYVHLLHGDDRVKEGYYKTIEELFKLYTEAGAAFCRYTYIDEAGRKMYDQPKEEQQDGILKDWLVRLAEKQRLQYVAVTVKREVYERLGAFYGATYAEDWEMWVRIAKTYPVAYTPEILAEYRKHSGSISGQKFKNAYYLDDLKFTINLIQQHLPANTRRSTLKKSYKFYSHYAIRTANMLWHSTADKQAVKNNVQKALKMHKDVSLLYQITKLYMKILLKRC